MAGEPFRDGHPPVVETESGAHAERRGRRATVSIDLAGVVTGWGPHATRLLGVGADEALGRALVDLVPRDQAAAVADVVAEALSGRPGGRERLYADLPSTFWALRVEATPIRDGDGCVVGATVAAQVDIGMPELPPVLADPSQRDVFDHAPLGQIVVSCDGTVVAANRAVTDLLRRPVGAIVDMHVLDLTAPEDRDRTAMALYQLVVEQQDSISYRKRYLRGDGTTVMVQTAVAAARGAEGAYFHAFLTDMTELDETAEALRHREQLTRLVVDALHEGVVVQDTDGMIVACNPAAEWLLGLTSDALNARSSHDPRWAVLDADGQPLDGDQHPSMVTLATGEPQDDVLLNVVRGDGQRVWLEVNTRPVLDGGRRMGVVSSFRDVTRRLADAAALQQANLALHRAAQDKNDLLAVASHELRTPLTPIIGFAQLMLARDASLSADQHYYLSAIDRNARRMLRLVDDLLALNLYDARLLHVDPCEVEVTEIVASVIEELGEAADDVGVTGDTALPRIRFDPRHLGQIVSNLLTNAIRHGAPPVRLERPCDRHRAHPCRDRRWPGRT